MKIKIFLLIPITNFFLQVFNNIEFVITVLRAFGVLQVVFHKFVSHDPKNIYLGGFPQVYAFTVLGSYRYRWSFIKENNVCDSHELYLNELEAISHHQLNCVHAVQNAALGISLIWAIFEGFMILFFLSSEIN